MALEVIEGRVEQADLARTKGKYVMYDKVRFREAGGGERALAKVCAAGDVAKAITPGASGRFYVTNAGGQTGIHGVRLSDGVNAYSPYHNMELIVLIGAAAGLVMLLVAIFGRTPAAFLPSVLGVLLVGAYFWFRSTRLAGLKQYEDGAAGAANLPASERQPVDQPRA